VTAPVTEALSWLIGAVLLTALLALFQRPLLTLGRLAVRTGAGVLCLHILAPAGAMLGVGLGVNLLNAMVLGVLGVPGFGLLLLLKYYLQ